MALVNAYGDRVYGALGIYHKGPRRFTAEDVRFTETICHLLSASLARASLEEDLRKAHACAENATKALKQQRAKIGEAVPGADSDLFESLGTLDIVRGPVGIGQPSLPRGESHSSELRSSPRRSFQYRQRIAPIIDKVLPTKNDFLDVECRDLSASGFAFYLNQWPNFSAVVVALGLPPLESFFAARVVRVAVCDDDGLVRYLLGCRFTGRVHIEDA